MSELQAKIDESQAKIDEVNAELPEQRERAEQSLSSLYKMQQGTPGLVSLLLSSDSFADFFTTYQYLNAVQRSNTDALAELNRMEGELSAAQQTLQTAKDEASAQQQQAQTSMTEAQTALDELNAQIAAQAAAEAAAQAQAEAQTQAQSQAVSGSSQAASSPAGGAPAASTPSNPSATDGSEVKSDGEWMIGMASAYSVDSNTGGNATASGDELTDDSMSVAVPLSQRYLLGRSVQIRYGGKTITAVVNDVGGFGRLRPRARPCRRLLEGVRLLERQRLGRARRPVPLPVDRRARRRQTVCYEPAFTRSKALGRARAGSRLTLVTVGYAVR